VIDTLTLARAMKRLTACMDRRCRPPGFLHNTFDAAPFGSAYVCVSPGEQGDDASANHNRVQICGADGGLTAVGLSGLLHVFDDAGIGRFFVWLAPGPGIDAVRGWLVEAGLSPLAYACPTLARTVGAPAPMPPGLDVRAMANIDGAETPSAAGAPTMIHYVAYDRERLIGCAALCAFDEIGYLGAAVTTPSDRRCGAQQALIAKRIETAAVLGCRMLVVEAPSHEGWHDLREAGFAPVYAMDVYGAPAHRITRGAPASA
jgi:hypothetical protein